MDQAAAAAAGQNKQVGQQSSVLGQEMAAKEAAASQGAGKTALAQTPEKVATQPRVVSNLTQELIKRPTVDVKDALQAMFSIDRILNIQPRTPEEQAKQQQIAKRWQRLTGDEQAEAQRVYQQNLAKKRQDEEAKEKQAQELEAQQDQQLLVPKGRETGFRGFGECLVLKKLKPFAATTYHSNWSRIALLMLK